MIPKSWAKLKFEEATPQDAPIMYGILQPGPDIAGGIPYVRPTEIQSNLIEINNIRRTTSEIAEQYKRSRVIFGDIILSIVGTIGKVAEIPYELDGGNITQSSCRIRPDEQLVERKFLRYYLLSPDAISQFNEKRLGTAVPRLNIADIRNFEIGIAPPNEQRRIVAKLDALTARLARARADLERTSRLSFKLKEAALDAAFSGRLTSDLFGTAETNERKLMPALDEVGRGTWSSGSIPASWTWVPFETFFSDVTSSTRKLPTSEYQKSGKYLVIDQGASSDPAYTNRGELVHPSKSPTIVFGDHTRHVKIANYPFVQGADGVKVLLSGAGVNLRYAYYAVIAVEIPNKGYSRHFKFLRATFWPMPSILEQIEAAGRLDQIFAHADRIQAEAARARSLIDRLEAAILAKAFRGELVPQDPNEEPASVLLARIRAERAAAPAAKRRGRQPRSAQAEN